MYSWLACRLEWTEGKRAIFNGIPNFGSQIGLELKKGSSEWIAESGWLDLTFHLQCFGYNWNTNITGVSNLIKGACWDALSGFSLLSLRLFLIKREPISTKRRERSWILMEQGEHTYPNKYFWSQIWIRGQLHHQDLEQSVNHSFLNCKMGTVILTTLNLILKDCMGT